MTDLKKLDKGRYGYRTWNGVYIIYRNDIRRGAYKWTFQGGEAFYYRTRFDVMLAIDRVLRELVRG